jgi:DNA primase
MDFVEQLKSSVDIVKTVGEYVRLKRSGSGPRYTGLCPFHNEKTPSFSVHSSHQFYKCFGCGVGGDVIKFVMEIERLTFYEALKLLAERNGVPMPRRAEYTDEETKLRAAIFEMHEIAAQAFAANLAGAAGADARAYLSKRGLAAETIAEFGLGLSERGGQALVRRFEKEGFPAQALDACGLVLKRQDGSGYFDRFRNRLMFPIHNESGKVIGFGGRALAADDEPKYLNSPETSIYRKSYVLYNLHRAKDAIRKGDRAVLVEGYMDAIGVYASGVREVVASCGTALTSTQVRAIKRHSERIVVNFDPDDAGARASENSIQMLLDEGMHVRILQLDGGLDPDEFVKQRGAAGYRECLDQAAGYFFWLADRARSHYDMRSAEGRAAAFEKFLLPAVQRISSKIERAGVANDIAGYLGVEADLVLEQFRKAAAERRETNITAPAAALRPIEGMLLKAILDSEEVRREVLPRLKAKLAVERFSAPKVFEIVLALQESQPGFTYADVEARLEPRERALLESALFADEAGEGTSAMEVAHACLRKLESVDRETRRAAVRARIREAERRGDLSTALELTDELRHMDRG